ncbi:hypothetical protein KLEPA_00124 (plasmid) [Klebsiella pneumoniae]
MALRWDRGPNPFRGRLEVIIGYEPLRILFFPCTEMSVYFLDCDAICSGGHKTVLTGSGCCNILCYSVALYIFSLSQI